MTINGIGIVYHDCLDINSREDFFGNVVKSYQAGLKKLVIIYKLAHQADSMFNFLANNFVRQNEVIDFGNYDEVLSFMKNIINEIDQRCCSNDDKSLIDVRLVLDNYNIQNLF